MGLGSRGVEGLIISLVMAQGSYSVDGYCILLPTCYGDDG